MTTFDRIVSAARRFPGPDGADWICLADVCKALGMSNPSQSTAGMDDDERVSIIHEGRSMLIGKPSGVFKLVLQNRSFRGKHFAQHIFEETLAELRLFEQFKRELEQFKCDLAAEDAARSSVYVSAVNPMYAYIGKYRIRLYAFDNSPFLWFSAKDFHPLALEVLRPENFSTFRSLYRDGKSRFIGDPNHPEDVALSVELMVINLATSSRYDLFDSLGVRRMPQETIGKRIGEALTIPNRAYVAACTTKPK